MDFSTGPQAEAFTMTGTIARLAMVCCQNVGFWWFYNLSDILFPLKHIVLVLFGDWDAVIIKTISKQ